MTLRCTSNTQIRAWRRLFPLTSMKSVVDLFNELLTSPGNINLAFASILLGYFESHLTAQITPDSSLSQSTPQSSRKRSSRGTGVSNFSDHPSRFKRLAIRVNHPPSAPAAAAPIETSASPLPPPPPPAPSTPEAMVEEDGVDSPMSCSTASSSVVTAEKPSKPQPLFPELRFEEAEALYQSFFVMIVNNPKLAAFSRLSGDQTGSKRGGTATADRSLVKAVCDVLCSHLSSSARQREHCVHAQSIYSLIKFGQLDSFGLAYSTVAACHLLGYSDVHLALSEDHAWVEFGPPERLESADISVLEAADDQPKTASHLHPPPVRMGHLLHSWLYLNGCPVVCRPPVLAVAAAVAAIQPCGLTKSVRLGEASLLSPLGSLGGQSGRRSGKRRISSSTQSTCSDGGQTASRGSGETVSLELVRLKQGLLWIFYRVGLLNRYPLGLTNLADIEEGYPSCPEELPHPDTVEVLPQPDYSLPEIVEVQGAQDDQTSSPASEADVPLQLLRRAVEIDRIFFRNQHVYPYIYLANYLRRRGDIPGALRNWAEAARVIGQYNHSSDDAEIYREFLDIATRMIPDVVRMCASSSPHLLESSLCLAYLIAFFDHMCLWEEGSSVPVLHVGWVDKLVACLLRFSVSARTQLSIQTLRSTEEETSSSLATAAATSVPSTKSATATAAATGTTRSPVCRPRRRTEVAKAIEVETKPLEIILPPTVPQSCSTTDSSILSFNNTPGTEKTLKLSNESSEPVKLGNEIDEEVEEGDYAVKGKKEDLLKDPQSLLLGCCRGSKEAISRLVCASQYVILNPKFLMGDITAPPYLTAEETDALFLESNQEQLKTEGKMHDPSMVEASDIPKLGDVEASTHQPPSDVIDEEKENHQITSAVASSTSLKTHSLADFCLEGSTATATVVGGMGISVDAGGVAASPESSLCPSLPSIASMSPAAHLTAGALTTEDSKMEAAVPMEIDHKAEEEEARTDKPTEETEKEQSTPSESPKVCLRLLSTKMCRIALFLNAPGCLKSSAIKLTLTAQSEVDFSNRSTRQHRRNSIVSAGGGGEAFSRSSVAPATE